MPQKPFISPEYAALNKQLHEIDPHYGSDAGPKYAQHIVSLAEQNGFKVFLDYGCGKGSLKPSVSALAPDLTVLEYDPAIPGKEALPTVPIDAIACLDVMEHIEPEHLDSVLQSMVDLKPKGVFLVVALEPAQKELPDGRNAHLIVKPREWWLERFKPYFATAALFGEVGHFLFIGTPLPGP